MHPPLRVPLPASHTGPDRSGSGGASVPVLLLLGGGLWAACAPDGATEPDDEAPPTCANVLLTAIQGSEGVLLRLSGTEGLETVERECEDGTWESVYDGAETWFEPGVDGGRYRPVCGGMEGEAVEPEPLSLALAADREDLIYLPRETIELDLEVEVPDVDLDFGLYLEREDAGETTWIVDLEGGETSGEATALTALEPGARSVGPVILSAGAEEPALLPLQAQVRVRLGEGLDEALEDQLEEGRLILSTASLEPVLLGRNVAWGEVHAHSNLSMDGCEDYDNGCSDREDRPAADFFDQAIARDLQFSAITDHAEYPYYYPDGEDGEMIDTWAEAQAVVQEADGEPDFVPILGYEWTNGTPQQEENDFDGGHKTVLLEAVEACDAWFIGSRETDSREKPPNGEIYYGPNEHVAETVPELWAALDAAAEECEEDIRVFTFFHHPALAHPEPVDWAEPDNAPDSRYETAVQIFSEHGLSECRSADDEACLPFYPDQEAYYGEQGSLHAALSEGHRLAILGGTDSHDGQPGSVEDGPSCPGTWREGDEGTVEELNCLPFNGSLTGAWYSGSLSRESLFDAFFARHTLATTGPRTPVRAVAVGADGEIYLPGDVIPVDTASPARLVASISDANSDANSDASSDSGSGNVVERIELVDPSGAAVASTTDTVLDTDLDLVSGDALYLRVRMYRGDAEHRLWASPWFGE